MHARPSRPVSCAWPCSQVGCCAVADRGKKDKKKKKTEDKHMQDMFLVFLFFKLGFLACACTHMQSVPVFSIGERSLAFPYNKQASIGCSRASLNLARSSKDGPKGGPKGGIWDAS